MTDTRQGDKRLGPAQTENQKSGRQPDPGTLVFNWGSPGDADI